MYLGRAGDAKTPGRKNRGVIINCTVPLVAGGRCWIGLSEVLPSFIVEDLWT